MNIFETVMGGLLSILYFLQFRLSSLTTHWRAMTYCFPFAWSKCIKFSFVTQKRLNNVEKRDFGDTELA